MVFLLTALLFFYCGLEVGFGSWVFSYAEEEGLADAEGAAWLNALFWLAIAIGRLLAVPLSARFSPPSLMCADMVSCLLVTVLMAIFAASAPALWILTLFFGVAMGAIFASAVAYPSWLGLNLTAKDTMWLVAGVALGEMSLPGAMGLTFEIASFKAMPYCLILFSGEFIGMLLVFPRDSVFVVASRIPWVFYWRLPSALSAACHAISLEAAINLFRLQPLSVSVCLLC